MSQYKYCLSAENNAEHNYATEKVWEPLVCEQLCFYIGCPNITDYVDERALVILDPSDMSACCRIIARAVAEDWHSQRLPFIRAAKERVMSELAFFPNLERILSAAHAKP